MKTIYYVEAGDDSCSGMFDENDVLLGVWHCNDANWRGEYLDGFLAELGIEVNYDKMDDKKLIKKMWDEVGHEPYEEEDDS